MDVCILGGPDRRPGRIAIRFFQIGEYADQPFATWSLADNQKFQLNSIINKFVIPTFLICKSCADDFEILPVRLPYHLRFVRKIVKIFTFILPL